MGPTIYSARAVWGAPLLATERVERGAAILAADIAGSMRLSPFDTESPGIKSGLAGAHLVAGRYEEALGWADWSLHEQPHYGPSLRVRVVSLVQLGRIEEARHCLRALLELQPGLTIAWYRQFGARFLPSETLAVGLEAFRKAGLPEERPQIFLPASS